MHCFSLPGKIMTATGNCTKLKPTDLHLPYMGASEERTLYVQNVPETWDKVC